MAKELKHLEGEVKKDWPKVISLAGGITALIGLFVSIGGGVTWLVNHHQQEQLRLTKIALAQTQAEQGDYRGSIRSYAEILKEDPAYEPALNGQLNTVELWVENFQVSAEEGEDVSKPAAAMLDQIMPILDAGLTRAGKGPQSADILAHIGWAHWLNEKIAEREFGPAAESNLRAALAIDLNNVYANAMLANWMLQQGGDLSQAMPHFATAVATGRARPFVRDLELGALTYLDEKGARAEQVRVANEMRKGGEAMDEEDKNRILSFCFDPVVTDHDELVESLSAVPPDDAWKTYLWLDSIHDAQSQGTIHDFVQASLLEISGDRVGALSKFQALQAQLKDSPGSLKDAVNASLARLAHG